MTEPDNLPAGPIPEHDRNQPPTSSVISILLDLQQQVARVEGTQIVLAQQNSDAADSRRRLHEKVDGLDRRLISAETAAHSATSAIEAMRPEVADWVKTKGNMKVGLAILGAVGVALVTIIGWLATLAWKFVVSILPHKF